MKKLGITFLVFIILLFLVLVCSGCRSKPKVKNKPESTEEIQKKDNVSRSEEEIWKEEKQVISGMYGDADVVKLDDGRYRMYYSVSPETPNNQLEMLSAISEDGINWTPEEGVRMKWAVFASVLKLADGRWRMYYQNNRQIKSAVSSDGLDWTEEAGVRIARGNEGSYDSYNVASPTVVQLKDGTYRMFYRGGVQGKYDEYSKNDEITRILSATSADGIEWKKDDSVVVDSNATEYKGLLDGPEAVIWDDGTLKLYFMSYEGIYLTEISKDGKPGSVEKVIDAQGPDHAPCDPSVIRVSGTWRMYYGIHPKGIYMAVLKP